MPQKYWDCKYLHGGVNPSEGMLSAFLFFASNLVSRLCNGLVLKVYCSLIRVYYDTDSEQQGSQLRECLQSVLHLRLQAPVVDTMS